MTDASFLRSSLLNPAGLMKPWQGEQATAFRETIALEFDNVLIASELVADARNVMKCDPTVLPVHALDRQIPRFSTVDETVWRIMLSKFRQIHATAGHPWCLLRLLRIFLRRYGRPLLRYVSTAGDGSFSQWHTLVPGDGTQDYFETGTTDPEFSTTTTTPANWLWDPLAATGHWSRFWIFIYTNGVVSPTSQLDWDGIEEYDDVHYWDGVIESTEILEMVAMINRFKASNSQLQGLFLVHDNAAFDPTGSGTGYPDGTWQFDYNRSGGVTYAYER